MTANLTIVIPGVATDGTACACGAWDCYFCAVVIDAAEEAWMRDMGYTVSCNRCHAVDRTHCSQCGACPDQECDRLVHDGLASSIRPTVRW
jgi:hypothetical protein